MITDKQYKESAKFLDIDVAAIKAVAEVESSGEGFMSDGKTPKILFEPHIFWKQLRKAGIDPTTIKGASDILYPVQGSKPYGKYSIQHDKLARAAKIHRAAALMSASWGKFQIMGFNWWQCGYENLQAFINAMYRSEDDHLKAFVAYIKESMLDDELRNRDWKSFARQYNGPLYWKNRYDTKLEAAYKKFKLRP